MLLYLSQTMSPVLVAMRTSIEIEDLKINCIIGILEHERCQAQDIFISLTVSFDSIVDGSDVMEDTIDYVALAKLCATIAQEGQYKLLETLAAKIITALEDGYPLIDHAKVTINKPQAIASAKASKVVVDKSFARKED